MFLWGFLWELNTAKIPQRYEFWKWDSFSNLGAAPAVQRPRTNGEHSIQTGGNVTLRRGSWLATAAGSCSSTTTPHSAGAVLGKPASWVALSVLLLHTHSWELPSWNRTAILPRLWHCDKERALKGTGHRSSLGLSFIPWPPTDGCSDAIGWGRKRFYW